MEQVPPGHPPSGSWIDPAQVSGFNVCRRVICMTSGTAVTTNLMGHHVQPTQLPSLEHVMIAQRCTAHFGEAKKCTAFTTCIINLIVKYFFQPNTYSAVAFSEINFSPRLALPKAYILLSMTETIPHT
jgi:hypothetical protein